MKDIFFVLIICTCLTIPVTNAMMNNSVEEEISARWYFIALGDSRNWDSLENNPLRAAIINNVVSSNPNLEFILHSGDLVNQGGDQREWDLYFEDIENATSNNVSIYSAIGNHEIYAIEGPNDEDFSTYMDNVDLPGNERFYSFDFGKIHFIVINTEEEWNGQFDITTEQKDWIIGDLTNNTLEFTVAVFHRPCYSVRSTSRQAEAKLIRQVLQPIFIEYGVDIVFVGHDHQYYRTFRDGVMHITTGGAGAPLYSKETNSEWQEGDVFYSEYHYINVSVTEYVNETVSLQLDMLIYHEENQSTTLGDSFSLPMEYIPPNSTTTTPPYTSPSSAPTYFSIFPVIFGVFAVVYTAKRKK